MNDAQKQRLLLLLVNLGALQRRLHALMVNDRPLDGVEQDRICQLLGEIIAARRIMYQNGDISAACVSSYADDVTTRLAAHYPNGELGKIEPRSEEPAYEH